MTLALDLPLPRDPRQVAKMARAAEEWGIDGLWAAETGHDPYVTLAVAALVTQRIALGTSITVAFPRTPLVHAQSAWDLALLAPGRVTLGLGPQVKAHNERRYGSTAFDHPAPRMRDMLGAIRAIFECWRTAQPLKYEGQFYTHTLMTPFFAPESLAGAPPPLHIAAVGDEMMAVAGGSADGVHIHPLHTGKSVTELSKPVLEKAASDAGRPTPTILVSALVATGKTAKDVAVAKEGVRSHIAFYASTPAYRRIVEFSGRADAADRLHALSREGKWGEMGAEIDDEFLEEVAVVAPWDELGVALARRYDGIVDRIAPVVPDPDVPWGQIAEQFHSAVAPSTVSSTVSSDASS